MGDQPKYVGGRPVAVRRPLTTALLAPIACVLIGTTLAACSSGSKKADTSSASTTGTTSSAASSAGSAQPSSTGSAADAATTTAVTNAFVTFFDGKAPIDARLALLQGADAFKAALSAQAGSPIIGQTSATVSAVKLASPNQAVVTYTLSLSGTPVLNDVTGNAVRINGTWKVAASTFCSLLTLQGGTPPAACTQAAVTALPS